MSCSLAADSCSSDSQSCSPPESTSAGSVSALACLSWRSLLFMRVLDLGAESGGPRADECCRGSRRWSSPLCLPSFPRTYSQIKTTMDADLDSATQGTFFLARRKRKQPEDSSPPPSLDDWRRSAYRASWAKHQARIDVSPLPRSLLTEESP